MSVLLYAALLAHLHGYREQYTKIGIIFVTTMMMKLLIKNGNKDHASMIGYAGGALTIGQFALLLKEVTKAGFTGGGESDKIMGGALGGILDGIKGIFIK